MTTNHINKKRALKHISFALIINQKFKIMRLILTLTFIVLFSILSPAQTLRGTIVDEATKSPLPGASIIIMGTDPIKGAISDANGKFKFTNLNTNRVSIKITYMGYQDMYMNKLDIYNSKELVLTIALEEKVFTAKTVEIIAKINKERPKNKLATVSARTFNAEETQRYAGSLGDPSRMAQNYAGVMSAGDSRNDIIIRGNSPMGLLWRMEGIDIPNPNHFGASGTTGGPVSMLNNNLLTNSDFFTGAFPAEYGNALSGVFDLQMRNGNNENYEFVGQVGFNGFELGAEGPFSKNSNASFLVNYRYSTLAFMDAIGLGAITGSSVPQYQDLTFKLNIPTKKAGRFVAYGIGGKSFIQIWDSKKEEDEASYGLKGTDTDFGSYMGVVGLYNVYYFNKNTRLKTNISASGTRATTALDSLVKPNNTKRQFYRSDNSEVKYSFSSHLTHKFNSRNLISSGVIVDRYNVQFLDSVYRNDTKDYWKNNDVKGSMELYQAYSQWKHKLNDKLNFNIGLHYQYFSLSKSSSIEPRAGMEWRINHKQRLSFGYGLHSQTQPKVLYFVRAELPNGESKLTNKNLKFTQSNQFVIAYNNVLSKNLRIKTEIYYQKLKNAPISEFRGNYSALNEGAEFYINLYDSLISKGSGENYGLEITFEKFLSKNYYMLATASIFSSKYKGYNGVEHSTAFDNNYVINLLGGYEFQFDKGMRLNIDLKGVYAGGKPYTPLDMEATKQQNSSVYDYDKSYSQRHADYFRVDFKISFRMPMGSTDSEWAFEVQNLTNHKNILQQSWDPVNKEIRYDYQQGFFPMFMYRIYF